jgi:hypothetical protein
MHLRDENCSSSSDCNVLSERLKQLSEDLNGIFDTVGV